MVILEGWVFLMSEVPLYARTERGNSPLRDDVGAIDKSHKFFFFSSLLLSSLELSDTQSL